MNAGPEPTGVLAVDVGNTSTRFGLFVDGALGDTWEASTPERLTVDEARCAVGAFLGDRVRRASAAGGAGGLPVAPADAVLSCVVPDFVEVWTQALRAECGRRPLVVGPGLKTGVRMRYSDPAEIGPDRIADLVAALAEFTGPLVVVDLGTTTNLEVVDADGVFVGGIIAPGLALGARSLANAAARLPVVELKAPQSVIGKNTREAMQAGVVMGEVARLDGLLDLVEAELGSTPTVVVTGTHAAALAALLRHDAQADDTLTLRGLHKLYEANRKK